MEKIFKTKTQVQFHPHWSGKILLLAALQLIGLGVLVFTAFLVTGRTDENNKLKRTNAESAWFTTQLSLDAEKFKSALAETGLETDLQVREAAFANAKEKFDIYYSRVTTTTDHENLLHIATPNLKDKSHEQLGAIKDHLAKYTELIDSITTPDSDQLLNLSYEFSKIQPVIRSYSLDVFQAVVVDSEAKEKYDSELVRYFVAVAISMFFVLSVAAYLSFLTETRLQDELALQSRLRSSLDRVVSASNDAIIVCDATGTPIKTNEAASKLFQIDGQKCDSADLTRYLLIDDGEGDDATLGSAPAPSLMSWLYTESGRHYGQHKKVRTIRNAHGTHLTAEIMVAQDIDHVTDDTAFIIFIRDITQIVGAQAALRRTRDEAIQNADVKTRFLAMMGHEMRTPLHCAITAIELVQPETLSAEARELITIAKTSARDALQHVDDILERTSMPNTVDSSEQADIIDPAQTAKSILQGLEVLAGEHNTAIEFESYLPDGFVFSTHPLAFDRAIRNIAENAVKFTQNGTVRVGISERFNGDGQHTVAVCIEDTGIGIHPDDHGRIFEDFESLDQGYSRQSSGVGLGLGIAYRAVMQMGGTMDLVSELGVGSRFTFEVPVLRHSEAPQVSTSDAGFDQMYEKCQTCTAFDPSNVSILVVEDHELNRRLLGKMLGNIGYTPDYASDGLEAVSMAEKNQYDLIFMDISMPKMDGVQATRAIRTGNGLSNSARITAITANALMEEQIGFMRAGMDSVLTKPVTQGQLKHEACMLTMKLPFMLNTEEMNGRLGAVTTTSDKEPAAPVIVAATDDTPEELSNIDMAVLEMLSDLMDRDELRQKIDALIAEVEKALSAVRSSTLQDDNSELSQEVHRSAGVAAMMGTPLLHRYLCELEDALRNKTDVDTASALSNAEKALSDAQNALKVATLAVA
ncbi:PAS domain-containing sensor histidine kinase [Meridianimarinicoccus aquatilis]|uniref:PAS domain-containing sensor histidine kinase n=1 Tax=Meridianimarinicoccus aquatilis TaxID=2552766 RepID=UPI0014050B04|nr:PAS domain-containing sensor histidine kinase [Fluviibacterium aquatile]